MTTSAVASACNECHVPVSTGSARNLNGYASTAYPCAGRHRRQDVRPGAPTSCIACGATRRSRATKDDARFEVSASPDFLNQAPDALSTDGELTLPLHA